MLRRILYFDFCIRCKSEASAS